MIERAARFSLKPEEAVALTPRDFAAFMRGAAKAEESRAAASWQRSLWAAWHGAVFGRAKKMPKLKPLLDRLKGRGGARQSGRQMASIIVAMNAALGGDDLRNEKENGV